jgi:hypothetical protein
LHDAEEARIDEIAERLGQEALRGFGAGSALTQHGHERFCAFG